MPTKRLPKSLVHRLKRVAHVIEAGGFMRLGLMKNIDHRKDFESRAEISEKNTDYWGRQVRELNVSRNYPKVGSVVIKRVAYGDAKEEIDAIKKFVRAHNQIMAPKTYTLVNPKADRIGKELVLMSKTSFPSIAEIIGLEEFQTVKGKQFFKSIKEKHGVSEDELKSAFKEFKENKMELNAYTKTPVTGIGGNLLLLGVSGKKFIFMPLIDMV